MIIAVWGFRIIAKKASLFCGRHRAWFTLAAVLEDYVRLVDDFGDLAAVLVDVAVKHMPDARARQLRNLQVADRRHDSITTGEIDADLQDFRGTALRLGLGAV